MRNEMLHEFARLNNRMRETEYIFEILRCLDSRASGWATPQTVYEEVRAARRCKLTAHDFAELYSGGQRFLNKIRHIRRALIDFGLLEPMRVRGAWQISELGREYVRAYPHVKLGPGRAVSIFGDENIV
jgi:hypothetical protein